MEALRIEKATGLPAIDAFRFGADKLVDALLKYLSTAPRPQFAEPVPFPGATSRR